MEKLENLKLSKNEVDTSMAREYIHEINKSNEWPDVGHYFIEKKPDEIMKINSIGDLSNSLDEYIKAENSIDAGNNLAKKIENSAEMFVQLEYLARGTDARDVQDGHIKLMSQLARCNSALWSCTIAELLFFTETMPLYNLASMVVGLYSVDTQNTTAIVIENKNMKPLAKFFVQLCHDVGLHVPLIYANPNDIEKLKEELYFWFESSDNVGCTGVIAERSDLDSAIDVFINSSVTAPWRLTQIYVQESVFEEFKDALAARSRGPAGDTVVAGDKTFLIEWLAGGGSQPAGVPVHAYRTTKELLSLLRTPYLSVWAAETALSHEIALRSPACTVWVNEYASFDGPPRSALSVFHLSCDVPTNHTCSNKLKETLKAWRQLETADRLEIIVGALKASQEQDNVGLDVEDLLSDFTLKWNSGDLLHVTDKTVCFGIQNELCVYLSLYFDCETVICIRWLFVLLKVLVNGNAVVCSNLNFTEFTEKLMKMGVPIERAELKADESSDLRMVPISMIKERLKVIRTNYGTIFAN